jgi:hypothetical protein
MLNYFKDIAMRFGHQSMGPIWNKYKVWILIGLAYTGFFFFKSFKALKQIVSNFQAKFVSS